MLKCLLLVLSILDFMSGLLYIIVQLYMCIPSQSASRGHNLSPEQNLPPFNLPVHGVTICNLSSEGGCLLLRHTNVVVYKQGS